MRVAAFCFGRTILYWDTVLAVLAAAVFFLCFWAAYRANGGRARVLFALLPLGTLLALLLSRLLYACCRPGQFSDPRAFLDLSVGGFCLAGVVIALCFAALLIRTVSPADEAVLLLDCAAPSLALALAILRLTNRFNGGCRGKLLLRDPRLQSTPFAAAEVPGGEYRLALYFISALLFVLFFLLLLRRYARVYAENGASGRRGDVFLSFLLLFGAEEIVIDSARNDACYFLFNAFVSVAQILAGLTLLAVLIVLARREIRAHGLRARCVLCLLLWTVSLGAAGVSEYLVQRHGDRALSCYALMSAAVLLMLLATALLRRMSEKESG